MPNGSRKFIDSHVRGNTNQVSTLGDKLTSHLRAAVCIRDSSVSSEPQTTKS